MIDKTPVLIVAALSKNDRALGKDNALLWHIPEDLKRFKELTTGHPIIMGRKTFESIIAVLGKPLPNRTTIVITRNSNYTYEGIVVVTSLEEAFAEALKIHPTEIHIGGGAEIYRQALPFVDKLYLTFFFDEKEADTFFPAFEDEFEIITESSIQESSGLRYQWVDYIRKTSQESVHIKLEKYLL